jgi:2,3-bisphosphoglycerate-independent phosphoglycerate mutase
VGIGQIVSLCGRFYAMDRDKNYDRIEKAYHMLVLGKATEYETNPVNALKNSHKNGVTDEFLEPVLIKDNNGQFVSVKDGDSVIFYNYRGDRARQISRSFTDPHFTYFETKKFKNLYFVGFTEYEKSIKQAEVAFYRQNMNNTLGEVLKKANCTQLRIAETTKYAHVTYFFNGGIETPNKGEDRILIQTKDVKTFDLLPQMSAMEIADTVVKTVTKDKYDFVLINFANCDMVGHTGNFDAAIKAVETVDKALGVVLAHFKSIGAIALVTADHGNAETMITKKGEPHTAHTTNLVPFILVDDNNLGAKLKKGILSDVSYTVLDLLNIKAPKEFTSSSLIKK